MPYLGGWNAERKDIADWYRAAGLPSIAGDLSSWHLFPMLVPNAIDIRASMHVLNVDVGVHYPYTLPPHHGDGRPYPTAESITTQHMTLPIGPGFTDEEVRRVVEVYMEVVGDPLNHD